ncbi:MAG: D-alanyl-D-alanine carboxypeptidase/D-alanyl-D-alanine-endopeptidase [Planctomyces sp.]|nr:D-alanyl-D-alanine carboxypeptidase/D-alanyl-D-alanine-endopeptidase [Planctomyces sp.]
MRSGHAARITAILLALVFAVPAFASDPPPWQERLQSVLDRPEYRHAHWGLLVVDAKTGDVVYEHQADKLFAPASVTKLFSVGAAWAAFGPDHRFITPVFRRGDVRDAGALEGDLVLRATGDLTLHGRGSESGEISFRNGDHTYANGNLTAQLTDENPLAGLDELARQVAAAGIRRINGDVLIDARLFEPASSTGSGPGRVTPMLVNDNLLDVLVTAAAEAGQPATVSTRPETALFTIDSFVETGPAGARPELSLRWSGSGRAVVRGKVPAGHRPIVRVLEWEDPEFVARGLFIEALQRAGIRVDASPLAASSAALPEVDWYATAPRVAALESPTFAEEAKLILKVSHNLHASTLPLLLAASRDRRTLSEGLAIQGEILEQLGVERGTISFGGGAGGDRADYTTPRATVQLLSQLASREDGERFRAALPILGVDGTLSSIGAKDSPARGRVFAKTGTLFWDNRLNGRPLLTSKALAGYIDAASGRQLAFACFVNLTHLSSGEETAREGQALGEIAEILQQGL